MKESIRIRRDRSSLSFSDRRAGGRKWLFIAWTATMVVLALVVWQFDTLQPQVVALLGQGAAPTVSANALANQGYEAYLRGDLETAETQLGTAAQQDPANIGVLYEYARVLLMQDKAEQGLAVAEQIIQLAPGDPRGYAVQVNALDLLDRSEEAIPIGLSALELNPSFAPTYAYLSGAYNSLGRWASAQDMGRRAIELDPANIDARRYYAFSMMWVGRYDIAVEQLEAAVQLHPYLDFLYFELALAYSGLPSDTEQQETRNRAAMVAIYQTVLDMEPDNVQALVRMCETYFGLRIDDYAQAYCEDALELDPTLARAWAQVGQIYFTRRNYESAIDAFETCVNLAGSQYIECWYLRGLAHYYLAECDEAVPILQEAMAYAEVEPIPSIIREGLELCAITDDAYDLSIMPTPAPTPTPVPTPIGVF